MLPVVAPPTTVARQVVAYSWAMVAASLVLVPVAHMTAVYAVAAALLGAWFLVEAYGLLGRVRSGERDVRPMRLFHGSITYLTLLFVAVAVDPLLPLPHLFS
jgi:protoheme IX farnesyltransferase